MQYQKVHIHTKTFILLLGILLLTGCEDSDVSTNNIPNGNNETWNAYISVTINTLSESTIRSNPTGGENGDGNENGLANENEINNLVLILFKGTDLNSSLNTLVSAVIYAGPGDILYGNTTEQKVVLEKDVYNLIVLVNTGDITSALSGMTVQGVCDYLQKTAWTANNGNYTNFMMSSADEATIDLTVLTDIDNPATASVSVQRMAVRIDIIPGQGNNGTNTYPVLDNANNTIANVTINRVKPVNCLSAGSYAIKRTATSVSATPTYLGPETPVSGNQTNYVIDPWTALKTETNLSGNYFNTNTGGAGTSPATALYSNYFTNISFSNDDSIKVPLSGENFYVLNYTMENTMGKDNQLNGYSTGVVYETTYIPVNIVNYDPSTLQNNSVSNTQAVTFFVIDNNGPMYGSLEAVEFLFRNGTQADDMFAYQFTTGNTWQQVKDYFNRIDDSDMLGFRAYLDSLLTGKTLTDNLDQNISWAAFMLSNYGYSNNNGNIILNQNGKNTLSLLYLTGIRAYENGLCYYHYWIRHSNDNTTEAAIMEFAIVRNNIYKLRVLSFSGPGEPEPGDPNIDPPGDPDEEWQIKVQISVKPWNLISHPAIVM